jgi:hypothetical protein
MSVVEKTHSKIRLLSVIAPKMRGPQVRQQFVQDGLMSARASTDRANCWLIKFEFRLKIQSSTASIASTVFVPDGGNFRADRNYSCERLTFGLTLETPATEDFALERCEKELRLSCCSILFTATKRMLGRVTASQIASASLRSFLSLLRYGFTNCGLIIFT